MAFQEEGLPTANQDTPAWAANLESVGTGPVHCTGQPEASHGTSWRPGHQVSAWQADSPSSLQWPHSACAWGHALPPDAKAREPRRTQLGGRGRGTMPGEGAPETLSLKTNLLQQTCAQPLTDMTHMRIRCTHTATQRTHVYNHLHMPAHTCTTSLLHVTTYLHTQHTQPGPPGWGELSQPALGHHKPAESGGTFPSMSPRTEAPGVSCDPASPWEPQGGCPPRPGLGELALPCPAASLQTGVGAPAGMGALEPAEGSAATQLPRGQVPTGHVLAPVPRGHWTLETRDKTGASSEASEYGGGRHVVTTPSYSGPP